MENLGYLGEILQTQGQLADPTQLYTFIVSYSHLNYPWLNFGNDMYFLMGLFCVLIIKSGFLFMWSSQPSIMTEVTIMLYDYFKSNPGVKDLPWSGIEPQSPSPCPVAIAMSYNVSREEENVGWKGSQIFSILESALQNYIH